MIKPGEIQNKAREDGVRDQQIEKDNFENYRFSEDLDFTLLNNDISNEQIFEWFFEVFEYIRDEANIPLAAGPVQVTDQDTDQVKALLTVTVNEYNRSELMDFLKLSHNHTFRLITYPRKHSF